MRNARVRRERGLYWLSPIRQILLIHCCKGRCAMAGKIVRGERLQIMLTREELAALDDWRFGRRMPSRAAAVREVLRRGLAADGFLLAESGTHSKDFGVIENPDEPA